MLRASRAFQPLLLLLLERAGLLLPACAYKLAAVRQQTNQPPAPRHATAAPRTHLHNVTIAHVLEQRHLPLKLLPPPPLLQSVQHLQGRTKQSRHRARTQMVRTGAGEERGTW